MPTEADRLTPESSYEETQASISSCIKQMMSEGGRSQEEIVAICHNKAYEATGREVKSKTTTVGG